MSSKIRSTHVSRNAAVYLRQSTMKQVHEHRESTDRQYALTRRAVELGWHADRVEVIDEDLGQSGTSTEGRTGFQRLAEEVSHGQIGVIFALEVSRLARSSTDWHHLLDLCGWADVLIADEHGVFSPTDPNDRLLLGLKGQMSEAERYWMRLRLHGARLNKARRGELRVTAPTGYVWDAATRRLQLDPDEVVQRGIRLIFDRFRIDGTAGQVLRYFLTHDLTLPVRQPSGVVVDKRPHRQTLLRILHNPVYAGAYVYGRSEARTVFVDGEVVRGRTTKVPMEAWPVCIREQHDAYVSWEEFVSNQGKLDGNRNRRSEGTGPPGGGEALLQGLVLCGRCGYSMTVQQGGQTAARYVCSAPLQRGTGTKPCWSLSAAAIDRAVAELFLEAAQPPQLELSLAVTREVERQAGELEQQWKLRLERARYAARLAERRYMAVDPDNRVVARTLENAWEETLREVERLDQAWDETRRVKKVELSEADRAEILALASNLRLVWAASTTTNIQRKTMLRLLVRQVALAPIEVPERATRIQVQWSTGAITETTTARPRHPPNNSASDAAIEGIRRCAAAGRTDPETADDLNAAGLTSGSGAPWTTETVRSARKRRGISRPWMRDKDGRIPTQRPGGQLSMRGVAERYGVPRRRIRRWVERGALTPVEGGRGTRRPMWFVDDDELEQKIRALKGEH